MLLAIYIGVVLGLFILFLGPDEGMQDMSFKELCMGISFSLIWPLLALLALLAYLFLFVAIKTEK